MDDQTTLFENPIMPPINTPPCSSNPQFNGARKIFPDDAFLFPSVITLESLDTCWHQFEPFTECLCCSVLYFCMPCPCSCYNLLFETGRAKFTITLIISRWNRKFIFSSFLESSRWEASYNHLADFGVKRILTTRTRLDRDTNTRHLSFSKQRDYMIYSMEQESGACT